MRWLHERRRGFWLALCLNLAMASLFWLMIHVASVKPTRGGLQSAAQIGATLLIAYAVETSWVVKSSNARGSKHEWWLGFVMGIGAAGLCGIGLALALSERLASDDWLWTDELLLGWVTASLAVLGCLIVSLPDLADNWSHRIRRGELDDD